MTACACDYSARFRSYREMLLYGGGFAIFTGSLQKSLHRVYG